RARQSPNVRGRRLQDALPRARPPCASLVLVGALRQPFTRRRPSRTGADMSEPRLDVLSRIGHTALVPLRRIVPANWARILLKLEDANPTGSMKDRMALAMIEAAEADGRLREAGPVVEYTGGSTGVSLSLVCAVKGHPLHVVTSDAFSREKLDHM